MTRGDSAVTVDEVTDLLLMSAMTELRRIRREREFADR
jgi:hypothetical protein